VDERLQALTSFVEEVEAEELAADLHSLLEEMQRL